MIRKILCPTDGSQNAEKAVSLASDLAQKYGAELILMHVQLTDASADDLQHFAETEGLEPSVRSELGRVRTVQSQTLMSGGPAVSEPVSPDLVDAVSTYALQSAQQIAASKGISETSTIVDRGNTGKRIVDRAEEEQADMIVMGSRGLSTFKGLLLGSVSGYVNSRTSRTCVTVH